MDIQETLKALYNELEEKAIEPQYYRYYIKDANQIIRKHFESYASQQMPSEDKIKKFAKGLKNTLDYVYHNGTSQEQKRVKRYIISQTMQLLSLQQENQTED